MNIIRLIRELSTRLAEAEQIVREGGVEELPGMNGWWLVQGKTHPYIVDLSPPDARGCSCPDAEYRPELRGWCKHRLAVELVKTGELRREQDDKRKGD